MGQHFIARDPHRYPNGATGWAPGDPFDCLGPWAKVQACPIVTLRPVAYSGSEQVDTGVRLTCYATSYADNSSSIPACTRYRGRYVRGFFTLGESGPVFIVAKGKELFEKEGE